MCDGALTSAAEVALKLREPFEESAVYNRHHSDCYTRTYYFEYGSVCWARTSDPLINSQLLYQLS